MINNKIYGGGSMLKNIYKYIDKCLSKQLMYKTNEDQFENISNIKYFGISKYFITYKKEI